MKKEIHFSIKERRALALFLVLGLMAQVYAFIIKPNLTVPDKNYTLDEILKELKLEPVENIRLEKSVTHNQPASRHDFNKQNKFEANAERSYNYSNATIPLRAFDPNQIDSLEWIDLGVKPWVVSNILKYQRKGGFFQNKDALQKIYGLDSATLWRIQDSCIIKKKEPLSHGSDKTFSKYPKVLRETININSCDTAELKTLYGIGSKLSSRIVKYRDKIGGFHSLDQMTEVYGVTPDVITNNLQYLTVSGPIKKLNINEVSLDTLSKHFYFNYKTSKALINYRKHHGPFKNLIDIQNIPLIDETLYKKIIPYITI